MGTNENPTTSTADKGKIKHKLTSIGEFESIEQFTKEGLSEIIEATKCANAFPQGASRDLYCAYPTFGRVIDEQSHRILGLISHVLKWQNVKGNIQRRQPDEQFEMLLECNDVMFERLQSNLDELAGIKKNPQTIVVESHLNSISPLTTPGKGAGSWNLKKNESPTIAARLITAKNIARPQVKFQIPVDNSADTPFTPKIKEKPNALKPLAILPEYDEAGNIISYLHPYEYELMKFEVPNSLLKSRKPQKPKDTSQTELVYVDTPAKLKQALQELRRTSELAIDVEHHSYRTFLGFTCLVQISSRSKDYILDALKLREEMQLLNEVFTNPKITKIFHGADSDIEWLQRDLSLYIVNMFDTHQAAKALNFARLSLAYLMKHYCDIEIDKTFQLADWRIRPLPEELVAYARQDTHFLIYIYERLTNDLLEASNQQPQLLRSIYQRSNEICKKRYIKPFITADTHMDIYRKSKRIFNNRQLYAFGEIFKWRDTIARLEDESYGYVLPNHMMLQISESLPREMQGILACCNPIPPLVRQNLHALHQIILKAREQPLVKPILEAEAIRRVAYANVKDYNSKLLCPHDLSHYEEFRDDLPTLLSLTKGKEPTLSSYAETVDNVNLKKAVLSVFDTVENSEEDEQTARYQLAEKQKILLPYQRYIAVLPAVEKEKREEAARIEAENKKRQLCPEAPILPVDVSVKNIKTEENDLYKMPTKEMLKRKCEESVEIKSANAASAKRIKTEENNISTTTPTDDKLKFVNLPPTKNELKQQQKNQLKRPARQDTTSVTIISDADDDGPPEERPSSSRLIEDQNVQQTSSKKNFKNKNKKKKFNNSGKAYQSSDKPVQANFDYQKVDFKKFQGGAQKAKGTELKPQFHGKGNTSKAHNKKFNKLFTFSNVKANKK